MPIEAETQTPGTVTVDLGEFKLIPGPKGDPGTPGERGPRGYGIRSAVLNPDYTLTLNFEDGSSYKTPSIRGENGTGISRIEIIPGGDYGTDPTDTLKITLTDGREETFKLYNAAAPAAAKAETAADRAEQAADTAAGTAAQEVKTSLQTYADEAKTSAETAAQSAQASKDAAARPARIGESGNWETWDAESGAYTDTGKPSRGETGPEGPQGPPGKDGQGAGDMTADVYDPTGQKRDIFAAVAEGDKKYLTKDDPMFTGMLLCDDGTDSFSVMNGSLTCASIAAAELNVDGGEVGFSLQASSERGASINASPYEDLAVRGLADPVDDYDAVHKKYVDDAIAGVPSGDYLSKDNPEFTGTLKTGNNWAFLRGASGEISVGGRSGGYTTNLNRAVGFGWQYNGNGDVIRAFDQDITTRVTSDVKIRGIDAPTDNSDAANKKYVDDKIQYGTSAPSALATGSIFLVYE